MKNIGKSIERKSFISGRRSKIKFVERKKINLLVNKYKYQKYESGKNINDIEHKFF